MKYITLNKLNFFEEIQKVTDNIDLQFLQVAFDFTISAHEGQFRKSGEPYYIHPLNIAYILAFMKMDTSTIIAGLLHDVLEDTDYKYSDLEERFGKEITSLVDGVTKLQFYDYKKSPTREELQAENFRKMLISITKDIRVILIKLADRLHNMRTLEYMPKESQIRIAQETIDIYAPMANRFGVAKIKWELEDLCLKYLHNEEYKKIIKMINQKRDEREHYIQQLIIPIKRLLLEMGIQAEVYGRSKHFYSIFRKKKIRKVPYEDIYDFAAIRIIVDSVEQCYSVLGVIHTNYEPIGRFRDYVARPKPNNYQSLHTIVITEENRKLEVQIRTKKMHLQAEEGIAAHWRYKELKKYTDKEIHNEGQKATGQKQFESQLAWIRNLLNQQVEGDSADFIEQLKLDLYPEIIVVMSPKGDLFELPKNSTPVDFAFCIHSDIGLSCIGAKINGKHVPLKTSLQSGDVVNVYTASKPMPSRDWLNFLKTSRARQKVRSYFHAKEMEDAIFLGKEIFEKKCRKKHYRFKTEASIVELLKKIKIHDIKHLYEKLGNGEILFEQIANAIEEIKEAKLNKILPNIDLENDSINNEQEDLASIRKIAQGIKIEGVDNLMIRYAKCCNPVPFDKILGYTTRGKGITIHRENCQDNGFRRLLIEEHERIISVEWDHSIYKERKKQYLSKLRIICENKNSLFSEFLTIFSFFNIKLQTAKMDIENEIAKYFFEFRVIDSDELNKIIKLFSDVNGVFDVERVGKK